MVSAHSLDTLTLQSADDIRPRDWGGGERGHHQADLRSGPDDILRAVQEPTGVSLHLDLTGEVRAYMIDSCLDSPTDVGVDNSDPHWP